MSESNSRLRLLVDFFLLMMVVSMGMFVWGEAQTDYTLVKPFVASLVAAPYQLKIQALDFTRGYNLTSSRWENVSVTVLNVGATNATGAKVAVELFNVNATKIAVGERGLPLIPPNTAMVVAIPLTWQSDKSMADYAFGKVTVA